MHDFPAETQTRNRAGREVLHHHLGLGDQPLDQIEPTLVAQVDAQAALAEVLLDEIGAAPVALDWHGPG